MSRRTAGERTALLVVDVQRGVFADAYDGDAVVHRIAELVDRARAADVPVIWVQHSDAELALGSPAWELVDELHPAAGEPRVDKLYGDAFEGTALAEILDVERIGKVVVTGGQTDFCIRSTLHGAFTRGYDVTLVSDAHSTEGLRAFDPALPAPEQVIAHTNAFWAGQRAPGRTAAVEAADTVSF